MTEAPLRPRRRAFAWGLFVGLAALVAALDLWSKEAVFDLLKVDIVVRKVDDDRELPFVARQQKVQVIPGFFELEANFNHGAFHGWFARHTGLLALLSVVALAVITLVVGFAFSRRQPPSLWFAFALALVAGGTAGNLYDRALISGVRDWVKWFFIWNGREKVWPNFNVADSGICVGVALLVLLELRRTVRERRGARAQV
jgi:signal peptidase II